MSPKDPDTSSVHDERLSGVSRRRLVQTLSAAGFSAGSALHLTADDVAAAADDQVPIVYALAPDPDTPASEENRGLQPRVKNVPADWYDDVQRAYRVHESSALSSRPGVAGTGVNPAEYGGKSSHIDVYLSESAIPADGHVNSLETARSRIPESVESVPTRLRTIETPELNGCGDGDCNNGDYGDLVPPGVECSGDDSGYLTLGPRIEDGGGAKYFITNHHGFNDDGKDPYGDKLDHPAQSDPLGEISQWDCKQDFAMAFPNSDHTIQTYTGPVECIGDRFMQGQFKKDGLSDRKAAGDPLHKIGQRTCHTQGQIRNVDGYIGNLNDGCSDRNGQVFWGDESDAKDGDSGSPTYAPDPESSDYYLVSSLHAGKIPSYLDPNYTGYAFGTGAYAITNKWGFKFV